jgi:predicted CXXCH cytochrome family protein
LVIGSGKFGQTYLYWLGDQLFQLPVSYLSSAGRWVNSPGFRDGIAKFDRPAAPRCLECQSTFFEHQSGTPNRFAKHNFVLGISCERCHGPGAEHIAFHRQSPNQPARHIIVPSDLSRDRQLDICAQCHSGDGTPRQPSFQFRPGLVLSDFIELGSSEHPGAITVHSNNQLQQLKASKCFQKSDSLTCTTCHDPHRFERGRLELFSKRCLKCHQPHQCGMAAELGDSIRQNCIDCHMKKVRDQGTMFDTATMDDWIPVELRDHRIAVYKDAKTD